MLPELPMAEISNTTLAILVFATLIGVVTSTVVLMNQETRYVTLTGFAPVDTGNVNLTIQGALHIEVNTTLNTINFGTCAPRAGGPYWCASNDTAACNGDAALGNCTGDTTTPQFIQVHNVGNVDASVNITSSCTAATLIGGTSPLFQFITTDCEGANTTAWTSLSGTTASACTNLSYVSTYGGFRMYANVTIPQNAAQAGCPGGVATITFSGTPEGS